LVSQRRTGHERPYELTPVPLEAAASWMAAIAAQWDQGLDAVQRYLRETADSSASFSPDETVECSAHNVLI